MTTLELKEEEKIKVFAKVLTIHGFRNSPIEDIHAGNWPKDKNGKFANDEDVIVTTKDGGTIIPWKECSRIDDEEMKHLNKTIHNQIYTLLVMANTVGLSKFFTMWGDDWDEPKLLEEWINPEKFFGKLKT